MKKTQTLALLGLTIALNIILTRFLSITPLPFVRISISFVAVAAGAMLCGPVAGGLAAAVGDVLGFAIFPMGVYMPGLTVSAFLSGYTYGALLHGKRPSVQRALVAVLLVCGIWEALLNSYVLSLALSQYAFWTIAVPRLAMLLVNVPLRTFVLWCMWRVVGRVAPQVAVAAK